MSLPTTCLRRLLPLAAAGVFAAAAASAAWAAPADTVVVKMAPGADAVARAEVAQALGAGAPQALPGGWTVYPLEDPASVDEARQDLAGTSAAAVEVPTRLHTSGVSNDPLLVRYQWGLLNRGNNGGTAGIDMGVTRAWDAAQVRNRVVVAVIDTGVDIGHPDLAGRIWTNTGEIPGNGIDDDGNGFVDDVYGWDFRSNDGSVFDDAAADSHGTHVAGIIAAQADNGIGVAGIAPNAVIMPLKFIGPGSEGGFNTDAARAIRYAVDNGATVINASFGGDTPDALLCDAVSYAASRGVSVVAAAGNNGRDIGVKGVWPAACSEPSLLTVTAVDSTGGLYAMGNYSRTLVDVGAPGVGVASTIPSDYGLMTGTSMAAPAVAAAAAVLRGENAGATPTSVRTQLMSTVMPLSSLSGTTVAGGMVSLAKALPGTPATAPAPAPATTASDTTPPDRVLLALPANGAVVGANSVTLRWNPSADASGIAGYELLLDGVSVAQTTDTQATVFAGDGAHGWQVRARDGAGNTSLSALATFTVKSARLGAPRITSVKIKGNVAHVKWTRGKIEKSRIKSFSLLVDGSRKAVTGPSKTAAAVRVVTGRRHQVVVRLTDTSGRTADSARAQTPGVAVKRLASKGRAKARVKAKERARVSLGAVKRGKITAKTAVTVRRGTTTITLPNSITRSLERGAELRMLSAQVAPARRGL